MIRFRRFQDTDLAGVLELFAGEGFETYVRNPEKALSAFLSPGSTSYVAIDGDLVVGFTQIQSDGQIQVHLSHIITHREYRHRGIARSLIQRAFKVAGGIRIDLLSQQGAETFYESFNHKSAKGFRIYPQ